MSRKPSEFHDFPDNLNVPYRYRAVVKHIVDGDTLDVLMDLGVREYTYEAIRLADLNAPEIYGRKTYEGELEDGYAAKAYLESILPVNTPVRIETFKDQRSFDRYVGRIMREDGQMVAAMMIAAGWTKEARMKARGISE